MKIHIHLGVHKTATTYIQHRLKSNMENLNAAGIGYLPVWEFRNSFWKGFMKLDPETFQIEDHLQSFFLKPSLKDVHGLIVSEENLLGLCGPFVSSGKLYNGVRARMAHLRSLLAGHDVTVFCAIRSYDEFIPSAYCEGLRSNRTYTSFADFHDRIDWKFLRWQRVLRRIEEGLQPARMVIWQYEQFREHSDKILEHLSFGTTLGADQADGSTSLYSSFSQLAMDTLDCVADQMGTDIAGQLVRPISETLAKSISRPSFNPWSAEQKATLKQSYHADCATIDANKWLIATDQHEVARKVA